MCITVLVVYKIGNVLIDFTWVHVVVIENCVFCVTIGGSNVSRVSKTDSAAFVLFVRLSI